VEALLRLFIAAPPVPLSLKIFTYMPTDPRSVLRIVRSAAVSMLRLPYQAYTLLLRPARPAADGGGGAAAAPSASPLGDAALLVLLVLLFHAPPPDAPWGNPYRQSLQRVLDADDLGVLRAGFEGEVGTRICVWVGGWGGGGVGGGVGVEGGLHCCPVAWQR
jgi:hypothetical protein